MAPPRLRPPQLRVHADGRRAFWGDLFGNPDGDVNVVKLKRHVVIAWHCHEHQTDRLFCVSGRVRVGMHYDADGAQLHQFLTLREGSVVTIPPNVFHGYESLTKDGILVQFNSPKWNPEDEGRHPIDTEMPWDS